MDPIIRAQLEVEGDPSAVFDRLVEDLAAGLAREGLALEPGPGGRVAGGAGEVARVTAWRPGEALVLTLHPASPGEAGAEMALSLASGRAATEVVLEVRGWASSMGPWADVPGWLADQVAAPLLRALSPAVAGDWITDRAARRPSGRAARETYRDPLYHYPNFQVILAELAPGPDDVLLDVGCGGGALLREALASGCVAAGVDHSPEMARVARSSNADAVADGRLLVVQGSAERLPFRSGTFTRASLTGVLGFLTDPVAALAEIRRTLRAGGRLVALGSDPALRGTPAAPEPIASRLRFYDDDELAALGRAAGFAEVTVIRRDLAGHARDAGVPEEHLPLFEGDTSFLMATR